MKITSISIKNFRSINQETSIPIKKISDRTCYILLGINGSGKSTLLDSISLIDGEIDLDYEIDCNKEAQENNESIQVAYFLKIDDVDEKKLKEKLILNGLDEDLVNKIKFKEIRRFVRVDSKNDRTDIYNIWIEDNKIFKNYNIKKDVSGNTLIKLNIITEGQPLNSDDILDKDSMESYLEDELFDSLDEDIPEVIFWRPSEDKYLINKPIDLNIFKSNPNISIPLKNCFGIAQINTPEKIKKCIESIVNKPDKTAELIQKLNESVTSHINDKWKEHKISVRFAIDNMQLSFLVEDKDNSLPKYGVSQRSDGFKHFISILLNISMENKNQSLSNKIILLDEPETHLHPSGQKYLRDELLEIAKNNIILFATHSVYMVDTKNIDRHYSIKKNTGKTIISSIEKNNPYGEEVLYEALGTSVLELMEPNVLLFEGKTDRDIFDLYVRNFKKDLTPPKISLISADGCSNIIKYTKFFNTKIIKGYILVDSDAEGITQKNLVLIESGYNKKNTFEINDIKKIKEGATLEDLFDKKYLIESIKEYYRLDIDLDIDKPFIKQIAEKIKENRKPYREEEKETLKKIYFNKISKLKKEELKKEEYYTFCELLCKKIS